MLFDAAWTSERDMATSLLEYTKKIVARPELGGIPGWASVAEALGDFDRSGPFWGPPRGWRFKKKSKTRYLNCAWVRGSTSCI